MVRKCDSRSLKAATRDAIEQSYAKVGHFITAASRLDVAVSELVASVTMIDDSPFAGNLPHAIDLGRKLEILSTLQAIGKEKGIDTQMKKIIDGAKRISSARNIVAHGLYLVSNGRLSLVSFTASKMLKVKDHEVEIALDTLPERAEAAEELSESCYALAKALTALRRTLYSDPASLREALTAKA
jgi:hypothetical protein